MIMITKLAASLLVQRDGAEIIIDLAAIPAALPSVLATLIDSGRAIGLARKEGYEAGLLRGYEQCAIERDTQARIAERQAAELVEVLIGTAMATAA